MPVDITAQMIPENIQEWFPAVTMAVLPAVGIPVASPNWNKIKCITEDQFKELQAKHGRLYQIDIHIDDTESYTFFAKRP